MTYRDAAGAIPHHPGQPTPEEAIRRGRDAGLVLVPRGRLALLEALLAEAVEQLGLEPCHGCGGDVGDDDTTGHLEGCALLALLTWSGEVGA